jgi:hypothetical protein
MKNFKTYIAESSLSRIMHHIEKTENFGVMSSFRRENTKEQNLESYKELIALVRKMGYGFIELKGGYQEESGFINEKSLFIPNIKKKEMMELGKKYDQHSIIIKDKQAFAMIGANKGAGIGKVLDKFEIRRQPNPVISVDDVGTIFKDFFSRLLKGSHAGKKFIFRVQEKVETSMYYYKKHGPQWATVYEEIE